VPSALLRYQWFALAAGRILKRIPQTDVLQLNGAIVHRMGCQVNVANFVHSDWLRSPYHPVRGKPGLNALYQYVFTRLNAAWEKRAFERAGCIVAVSDQIRDALTQLLGINSIVVIQPGVDIDQFRPLATGEINRLRGEIPCADPDFLLMFVGDIRSNRKNLDVVLQALARLPRHVRLVVVGDASKSPYPALAKSLGVAERTHFLGRRTIDLPELMRGANAFVFPSHYDPFALVITEAMASGLAVVTAPTVGASGLIRDGQNGFVLPNAADVDTLVRIVATLDADRACCQAIGAAARATAQKHTWSAMVAAYEQLYQNVIDGSAKLAQTEPTVVGAA
jgi:glycosyltransferase involved in cell wall biosynthesis